MARHYLVRCGHHPRNIRVRRAPRGQGSGEQFVRNYYPIEVEHYRSRSKMRQAALVVAIDADAGTVKKHERELERVLVARRQAKRAPAEKIASLIPKRHIETWVLCLSGETVDEIVNYKNRADIDGLVKPAAAALYEWSRPGTNVPVSCVPSLRNGLKEVRRIG